MELKQVAVIGLVSVALLVALIMAFPAGSRPRPRSPKGAVESPERRRPVADEGEEDPLPQGLRSGRTAGGEGAAQVFDFQTKLAELRELYQEGRYQYAIGQAQSILAHYDLEPRLRMEIFYLLYRCYRELGEPSTAEEYLKKCRAILERLAAERAGARSESTADAVRKMVVRAREEALKANPNLRDPQGDERPLNERCWEKLVRASKEEVLKIDLPEGGTIYCSKSGQDLEKALLGVLEDPIEMAIGRDPQYRFYYQIVEKIKR